MGIVPHCDSRPDRRDVGGQLTGLLTGQGGMGCDFITLLRTVLNITNRVLRESPDDYSWIAVD